MFSAKMFSRQNLFPPKYFSAQTREGAYNIHSFFSLKLELSKSEIAKLKSKLNSDSDLVKKLRYPSCNHYIEFIV